MKIDCSIAENARGVEVFVFFFGKFWAVSLLCYILEFGPRNSALINNHLSIPGLQIPFVRGLRDSNIM